MEANVELYNYLIKILILGDAKVGKTSLLTRFTDNTFDESHTPTIGIDFKQRLMEVREKIVKIQIWDTAGQERFHTITHTYYKGAMGAILLYDISDLKSFSNLHIWFQQIKAYADANIIIYLVGSKSDLISRVVSPEQAQSLVEGMNIKYYEVSSKEDLNVIDLFEDMAGEIIDRGLTAKLCDSIRLSSMESEVQEKVIQRRRFRCCIRGGGR